MEGTTRLDTLRRQFVGDDPALNAALVEIEAEARAFVETKTVVSRAFRGLGL
jgi:hypothetical protein